MRARHRPGGQQQRRRLAGGPRSCTRRGVPRGTGWAACEPRDPARPHRRACSHREDTAAHASHAIGTTGAELASEAVRARVGMRPTGTGCGWMRVARIAGARLFASGSAVAHASRAIGTTGAEHDGRRARRAPSSEAAQRAPARRPTADRVGLYARRATFAAWDRRARPPQGDWQLELPGAACVTGLWPGPQHADEWGHQCTRPGAPGSTVGRGVSWLPGRYIRCTTRRP
jgi:hypothetical protein